MHCHQSKEHAPQTFYVVFTSVSLPYEILTSLESLLDVFGSLILFVLYQNGSEMGLFIGILMDVKR